MSRSKSKNVSVWVDVDVDLEEFSIEDLQEELESRFANVPGDTSELIVQMWQAFYIGREDRALVLARQIAEQATGRLVPVAKRTAP